MTEHSVLDLGSFKQIMIDSTCDVHKSVIRASMVTGCCDERPLICTSMDGSDKYDPELRPSRIILRRSVDPYPELEIEAVNPTKPHRREQYGDEVQVCQKGWMIGLALDSSYIRTTDIRCWMYDCLQDHGDKCSSPFKSRLPPPRPSWLIDTWQQCVVKAPPDETYMALSYVWGSRSFCRLMNSTCDSLSKVGSLADPKLALPRTIRDAVCLVKNLSERYLWVDSLCIVQDDEHDIRDQIENMGSIYANALVVVVAEQGEDAYFGLQGVSLPRKLGPHRYKFGSAIIVEQRWSGAERPPSLWSRRGWTFQEQFLNTRRIVFCRKFSYSHVYPLNVV